MSDPGINALQLAPQQPVQQMASLAQGFQALDPGVPVAGKLDVAPPPPFVTNPVPPVPPNITDVKQITNGWHKDPFKQGLAEGFVTNYANQMPGGLGQTAQHFNTFQNLMRAGTLPNTGDDAETHRLWNKFNGSPERMSSSDSAALANQIRTVGTATEGSPDLRFDPVGVVGKVGSDGSVRVDYPPVVRPADLNLRALAPTGVTNLRRMASIGEGAPGSATPLDVLPAFLGLNPQERPNAQGHADLLDTLTAVAKETNSDPAKVAANVAAGWATIAPHSLPWQTQWASTINGPNPAAEALSGRLSSKIVQQLGAGVQNMDFTGGKNLSVTTGPAGTAVSGHPTVANGKLLRHMYPAFTVGGTTAWLPGAAAKTADVTKLNGDVSIFNGPVMDAMGGHPGLIAGDHIMFDAPRNFQAPVPAQPLGPTVTTQPEFSMDRLGPATVDADAFTSPQSALNTHAWALIPGGNALKVALTRKGFDPIPHTIGDGDTPTHMLTFGITPQEATKIGSGEIVTNKGVLSRDGFRPGDGVSFTRTDDGVPSVSHLLTGDVQWFLSGADRTADPTDPAEAAIDSTQMKGNKQLSTLDPNTGADLAKTITSLQAAGASNLRVYSHRDLLDGFKVAYEHIYTDDQNYASHLSPNPSSAGHVVPVFVPANSHVPVPPEQIPSVRQGNTGMQLNGVSVLTQDRIAKLGDLKQNWLTATGNALVPTDGPGDAQLVGTRLLVKNPTIGAANVIRLARLAGMPDNKIDAPLPGKLPTNDPAQAITISGAKVPALKRTQPVQSWADQHGVEFDPAYRTGTGIQTLDPHTQSDMADVYSKFVTQHPEAAKLWGLNRIAMTTNHSTSPAYTEWGKLGGAIGLSSHQYSDVPALTATLADQHARGVIAGEGPAYPLAHELGHVVHGALQFGSDGSGARAALLALRKSLGVEGISSGLSKQAVHSPEEMVAESVAQGLTGTAGAVATQVLDIVNSGLSKVTAARTKVQW